MRHKPNQSKLEKTNNIAPKLKVQTLARMKICCLFIVLDGNANMSDIVECLGVKCLAQCKYSNFLLVCLC